MTRKVTLPAVPPNRVIREGDVPPRRPPPSPPDDENPGRDVTSAPRYRIVTDGTLYKVQRRGWFFWRDCSEAFRMLSNAREVQRELEDQDRRDALARLPRWTVVR